MAQTLQERTAITEEQRYNQHPTASNDDLHCLTEAYLGTRYPNTSRTNVPAFGYTNQDAQRAFTFAKFRKARSGDACRFKGLPRSKRGKLARGANLPRVAYPQNNIPPNFQWQRHAISTNDILQLLDPDSAKHDDERVGQKIGQFGTGLLSTRIQSRVRHTSIGVALVAY